MTDDSVALEAFAEHVAALAIDPHDRRPGMFVAIAELGPDRVEWLLERALAGP